MKEQEKKICCICKKEFVGYGNNPYPVKKTGECCDTCNQIVVMVRLELDLEQHRVLR